MFFYYILRFINGYVVFKAGGGFSERFVNLCNIRGIRIYNIKISEKEIEAQIRRKDYKHLRKVAKDSGMKIRAISKHGLPFFVARNRKRIGLVYGFGFFVLFMSVMSMFIWSVETTGSDKLSDTEILKVVSECGVHKGTFRYTVKSRDVARDAINKLNGKVLWMSVNIKGSRAVVEVRDFIEKGEDMTYTDPCNIVADFDGLLLSVEVESGTKANYEGNGVKKGDLLISGMLEDRYERTHFYEARGVVTALHNNSLNLSRQKKEKTITYFKSKSVHYLDFLVFRIPLGFFPKENCYDEFIRENILMINNVRMPFGTVTKTRAYYEEKDSDSSPVILYDDFSAAYREKYKNTYIVSSKLKIKEGKNNLKISSDEKCIDFMGKKQIISFAD